MEQISSPLNDVLIQALELSARERLQLIERIAASVEGELVSSDSLPEEHWGKSLNALLETLDLSEWNEIEDPETWLQTQRENALRERLGDWDARE